VLEGRANLTRVLEQYQVLYGIKLVKLTEERFFEARLPRPGCTGDQDVAATCQRASNDTCVPAAIEVIELEDASRRSTKNELGAWTERRDARLNSDPKVDDLASKEGLRRRDLRSEQGCGDRDDTFPTGARQREVGARPTNAGNPNEDARVVRRSVTRVELIHPIAERTEIV
jgi:hypothetical protein